MTKRLNLFLIAVLLLTGIPYYWLFLANNPGDAEPEPVTIAQLRQLAAQIPGNAPYAIEMERAAFRHLPGNVLAAGSGMKRRQIAMMAFRLPVSGSAPIVIDSGLSRDTAEAMGVERYYPDGQAKIDAAMLTASRIIPTHEHADHMDGLLRLAAHHPEVLAKAAFNPGQLPPSAFAAQLHWPVGARPTANVTGKEPRAVAPGVVVIPAPSHTPGSQMIFVRLSNGREYLFAGDIATMAVSWEELRGRSNLVQHFIVAEDRPAVFSWLRTLRELKKQAPQMFIIPGHDIDRLFEEKRPSGIIRGFGAYDKPLAFAARPR